MDFTQFKRDFRDRLRPVILGLDSLGLTPLGVSLLGLFITAVSGWIIAKGALFLGALVFLIGSAFDMLDGDLARLQGTVSKRGAFLDSCFDRLGEAFLFAGLTWYFAGLPLGEGRLALLLITGTVVGSLTTSYVRARAEGVGETCQVGFLQRTERVILLTVGLLLGRWALVPILGFLTIATLATTVQRIVHVAAKLPGPRPEDQPVPAPPVEEAGLTEEEFPPEDDDDTDQVGA
jgi:CDP-diacylglycerol--glycerol-3-phosphate 3-phosphatidyltransferase